MRKMAAEAGVGHESMNQNHSRGPQHEALPPPEAPGPQLCNDGEEAGKVEAAS